jgi:hypothetical protein
MSKGDITQYKNEIMSKLVFNENIVKALIIGNSNFLDVTPIPEQQIIIDDSPSLLYNQVFPYRNTGVVMTEDKVYITSMFGDFKKKDVIYKYGTINFYIIVPNSWVRTSYGNRHDFILDEIEEMFTGHSIGDFEVNTRGDIPIDNKFVGGFISFRIVDFD